MSEPLRNPVDELAEEFVERYRRGERPGLTEYTDKRPELAKEIRELFPALIMIEEAGPAESPPLLGGSGTVTAAGQALQQLGDYRIVRQIGRGGMGVVFEAVQEALGRHVALKVLPLAFAKDPIHLKRFRREARSAARLHHTNIVPVFDVGEWQGIHYYAMQFIQGQGLDEVWQELRRMRGLPRGNKGSTPGHADTDPFPQAALEVGLSFQLATGMRTGQFGMDQPDEDGPRIEYLSEERGSKIEDRESKPSESVAGSSGFSREERPPKGGTTNDPRSSILDPPSSTSPPFSGNSSSSLLSGSSEFKAQTDYHFYRSVARVGLQVAEALAYAHAHKVLHRDIKPSNLLLDRQGTVWVTDFGLAKEEECEDLTRTGDIVGTLRYMAPERLNGTADPRSDIYGLGMTLYELLTLQPVFPERDRARLMQQIMRESPTRPRKMDPRIPRDLETIVCKATAKEPRDRYPTAEALAEDLSRFLADRPIKARRSSAGEQVWRWCRRNPAGGLAIAATIATIVTLALAVFFVSQSRDDARQLAKEKEELANTERGLRRQAELDAAKLSFEQAYAKCLLEDAGRGMLWLSHSLDIAHRAEDNDLEGAIRYQLAAWSRYVHPLAATFRHRGIVEAVAYSPDGKTMVTGSMDWTARLWDVATQTPVSPPLPHQGAVRAAAFSPDGKIMLTGSDDHMARLWEVATGKTLGPPLKHQGSVHAVAFSPDGKMALTGSFDKTAQLWEVASGQPVGPPLQHDGWVLAVAFSPDGKMALTGGFDQTARLWVLPNWDQVLRIQLQGGPAGTVAFSPDAKLILTTGSSKAAQLWDVATGKAVGPPLHHEEVVDTAAFSPDGKIVATGSHDETARLWEVPTGKLLTPPLQHQGYIRALAFSRDGKTLLTGSWDRTARLWDVTTGKPVGPPLNHRGVVGTVAFSPDGQTVLTGSYDCMARLWRLGTGKAVGRQLRLPAKLHVLAFSPDGQTVLTADNNSTARLWDLTTGKPVSPPLRHLGLSQAGAVSPDGQTVLTGSWVSTLDGDRPNTARLWEVATGNPLGPFLQHQGRVRCAAFSPSGKIVLTGSDDKTAQLWEAGSGKAIGPALRHGGDVVAVAFSTDGKTVLTGGWDGLAQLWEAETGQPVGPPLRHQGPIKSVAFSPDGKIVLTGSEDGTAQLWQVATGNPLGPPLQHQGIVEAVAFSPDRKTVLTGSRDNMARLWEVGRVKAVGSPLQHQGPVYAVAFSPDGKTVLTASEDRTLRRWEILPPVTGEVERIKLWTEVLAGMELHDNGGIHVLDAPEWEDRRRLLQELGGPPEDPMSKR